MERMDLAAGVDPGAKVWGLSPKAREALLWMALLAAVAIPLSYGLGHRGPKLIGLAAQIGGEPRALVAHGSTIYVGGGSGAIAAPSGAIWRPVESLKGHDVMAWAQSGKQLLAAAHDGLYVTTDGGTTFTSTGGRPVIDVHGLGAAGSTVYLASPDGGLYVSGDHGTTFKQRSELGRDFMGSIWVDPTNPQLAIAPSMQQGAVKTTNGGLSWHPMGGPPDAMAVAVNSGGDRVVVVGISGVETSADMGASWQALAVPAGATTAAFGPNGQLFIGTSMSGRTRVFRQDGDRWTPLDGVGRS